MKIFYVNVIEQHAGWGAEWFVDRAFHSLGHETHCLDYRAHRRELYRRFLAAPDSDVFLLQRGDHFPLPLVRAIQVPRFFWASELVSRCRDQDPLLQSGLFSHVFLHSQACVDEVVRRGWLDAGNCSALINGVDPEVYRPLPGITKDIDVLFVGSQTPRRREMLRMVEEHCRLLTASAFGPEAVHLFNRARVVLNMHAEEAPDTETRVFETLGCGAFLLSERLSSDNPFSEHDFVQFDSVRDLVDKIRYYLAHGQEREAIAAHGHASALAGHTYLHRAQHIAEVMARYAPPGRNASQSMLQRTWLLRLCSVSERFRQSPGLARSLGRDPGGSQGGVTRSHC